MPPDAFLSIVGSILLVICFFGGSIFVHELGHFLAARWRGLKVERFAIGFPPKLWARKYKGVEYSIGALPLGGYVALPQLADMGLIEGKSKDDPEQLPPISYRDKVIVSAAGAFFNILFALLIATVLWGTGQPTPKVLQSTQVGSVLKEVTDTNGQTVTGPAFQAGLLPGDRIVEVDGYAVHDWEGIAFAILRGAGRTPEGSPQTVLTVQREAQLLKLEVEPILYGSDRIRYLGIGPGIPIKVGDVIAHSPADKAGIVEGDVLLTVNGEPTLSLQALDTFLQQRGSEPFTLEWERSGQLMEREIRAAQVVIGANGEQAYKLGFKPAMETVNLHRNPLEQINRSVSMTFQTLSALLNRNTDIGLHQLSGPPGIAYAIHRLSGIDLRYVLGLVVLINVNLAILNLLPIPVLDGGHILFATLGKLRGKPLPAALIQTLQGAFMFLLLLLMAYVMFHDVIRVKNDIEENEQRNQTIKRLEENSIEPVFSP